jgi:hypothetical protein
LTLLLAHLARVLDAVARGVVVVIDARPSCRAPRHLVDAAERS